MYDSTHATALSQLNASIFAPSAPTNTAATNGYLANFTILEAYIALMRVSDKKRLAVKDLETHEVVEFDSVGFISNYAVLHLVNKEQPSTDTYSLLVLNETPLPSESVQKEDTKHYQLMPDVMMEVMQTIKILDQDIAERLKAAALIMHGETFINHPSIQADASWRKLDVNNIRYVVKCPLMQQSGELDRIVGGIVMGVRQGRIDVLRPADLMCSKFIITNHSAYEWLDNTADIEAAQAVVHNNRQ